MLCAGFSEGGTVVTEPAGAIDQLRKDWRHEEAEALGRQAVAEDPGDPARWIALGRVQLHRYRREAALESFGRAAECPEAPGKAVAWQVAALSRLLRYDDADETAAKGLERFPRDPDILLARARIKYDQEDWADAEPILAEAREADPGRLNTARWQVTVLAKLGRFEAAEAAGRQMVERHPARPVALDTMAWMENERGQHTAALPWADRALEVDPRDEWAWRLKLHALRRLERFEDAAAVGRAALEARSGFPLLLLQLGLTAYAQKHYEESLDWFERAREIAPWHGRVLCCRVLALGQLERFDEADEAVRSALEVRPDDVLIMLEYGWAEAERSQEKALAWFERVLGLDPRNPKALVWRVKMLRRLRRFGAAEAAAREGIDRRPGSADCLVQAGEVQEDQFRFEQALDWAERALAIDPEHVEAQANRLFALRRLRRYDEAAAIAKEAAEREPESAYRRVLAGAVEADRGRQEAAIGWYDQALALDPGDKLALQAKIVALRLLRRSGEADAVADDAMARYPGTVSFVVLRGWNCEQRGQYQEALDWFQGALDLDPGSEWAWRSRLSVLISLRRFEQAETVFAEAERQCPDDAGVLMQRVWLELGRYQYEEALVWCGRALALDPTHAQAWEKRLTCLRALGRLAEAETVAAEAIAARPDEPDLLVELAWVHEGQGRSDEALSCLDRALLLDPGHDWALRTQSALYTRMRRFAEAKASTQAALDRRPDNLLALSQLASSERIQSGPEASLPVYQRMLSIDPRDPLALEWRVTALRALRRFDEARRAANEAIARCPEVPDLRVERALLLGDEARFEESLDSISQALDLDPRHAAAWELRVTTLRRLRRFEEAETAVREAIELRPDEPDLLVEYGLLHDEQLHYEESLVWFERALRMDPFLSEALTGRSAALRSLRRFDEAERGIRAVLERMPWARWLREELVWIYHDSRRLDEADRQIAVLRADSQNVREEAETAAQAGWIRFAEGDYPAAEEQFREACEKDPLNVEHEFGLAWCLVRQATPQSRDEAEKRCFSVLEKESQHHSAHTCLGVINYQRRNYAQAEQHFRRAIELDRNHASYVDLGALYSQLGRFEEAEKNLSAALERDWYDAQAHIELGYLHLQRGIDDPESKPAAAAVRHFRQARQIDPANGSASLGLAVALMRSPGDFVEGEAVLQQALRRDDCDLPRWQLLVALAKLLIVRGDTTQGRQFHADALARAQEAISLAAHEAEPYFVAAVARYKLAESAGDFPAKPMQRRKAIRDLRRCVEIDPGNVEAQRSLQIMEESLRITRSSTVGSVVVVVVGVAALSALWTAFFLSDKVTGVMLTTLTPILVGLMVVGLLLPFLIRLKLPGGVEADLSASIRQISSGPTGEETFGPGRFSVTVAATSPGPQGQLARL